MCAYIRIIWRFKASDEDKSFKLSSVIVWSCNFSYLLLIKPVKVTFSLFSTVVSDVKKELLNMNAKFRNNLGRMKFVKYLYSLVSNLWSKNLDFFVSFLYERLHSKVSLQCWNHEEKNDVIRRLVGWVLWHINLCRLFNAKSTFIQIISSISNNSV